MTYAILLKDELRSAFGGNVRTIFKEQNEFLNAFECSETAFRAQKIGDRNLLTTDSGEYLFLCDETFEHLQAGKLDRSDPAYADLLVKQIIGSSSATRRFNAAKVRTKKAFITEGQTLHLFVVTLRCDHGCHYCQVSRQTSNCSSFDMTEEDARAAVDLMFQSPARHLTIEFQGGEPLLAFERIRQIIDLIEQRKEQEGKRITFTITSTLHHIDDEIIAYLRDHDVQISTSLDGPAFLHNANRPTKSGDSYEKTVQGVERLNDALGAGKLSALTTLTRASLEYPEAIVDEYVRLGFRSIFLRPLSPYGFAQKSKGKIGYSMSEFVKFYDRALRHILDLNEQGVEIQEAYASILLSHILTPFASGYVDLRSPAGAGLSTFVYNYDGYVYASDEGRMLAEMGDLTFRLGRVGDPYDALMASQGIQAVQARGTAEELRTCASCAFLPYCGADPVQAHAVGADIDMPAQSHCDRHMGLFRILFRHLEEGRPTTNKAFLAWALRVPQSSLHGSAI